MADRPLTIFSLLAWLIAIIVVEGICMALILSREADGAAKINSQWGGKLVKFIAFSYAVVVFSKATEFCLEEWRMSRWKGLALLAVATLFPFLILLMLDPPNGR